MSENNRVLVAAQNAPYPLFIPFITAGDPNPEVTVDLALMLQEAGAHIIELGVPYSDPLADGPIIQRSAQRALAQGMSLSKAIDLVPKMREKGLTIPVIIFTYYNPVLQLGEETFLQRVRESKADGVLIPDLPFEESESLASQAKSLGLANISLVAPTSDKRIDEIASRAEGFLYCVSSTGVTGVRDHFPPEAYTFIKRVKESTAIPVAVGFGISKRAHVESLKGVADGVIVGSAIMKKVEEVYGKNAGESELDQIKAFVSSLISS